MEGNLYLWALHPCGRIPWQFPKQALSSNHSTACCSRIPWPCSSPAGRKNAAATSSSRSRRRRPGFRPSRYVSFKTENCCSCISLVHAYKFTVQYWRIVASHDAASLRALLLERCQSECRTSIHVHFCLLFSFLPRLLLISKEALLIT